MSHAAFATARVHSALEHTVQDAGLLAGQTHLRRLAFDVRALHLLFVFSQDEPEAVSEAHHVVLCVAESAPDVGVYTLPSQTEHLYKTSRSV